MPDHRERPRTPELPEDSALSTQERGKVVRAAVLRPLHLLMLFVGGVFFAITGAWWVLPLTILTYGSLTLLAIRDQSFKRRVLEGPTPSETSAPAEEISPERRARWLPRGETRSKVEAALEVYRKTIRAIQEADEVTQIVLEDAQPRLHASADRLVNLATDREKASAALQEIPAAGEAASESRKDLQSKVKSADAEISSVIDKFLALRARVVRISLDSGPAARAMADDLNSSLDELNHRLEALSETMSSPDR